MVYTGKKFFNVAFEHPARAGMAAADLKGKIPKPIEGFVHPLVHSAGIGIGDKDTIER